MDFDASYLKSKPNGKSLKEMLHAWEEPEVRFIQFPKPFSLKTRKQHRVIIIRDGLY